MAKKISCPCCGNELRRSDMTWSVPNVYECTSCIVENIKVNPMWRVYKNGNMVALYESKIVKRNP